MLTSRAGSRGASSSCSKASGTGTSRCICSTAPPPSYAGVPPVQALRRADGKVVRTLADNGSLTAKVAGLSLPRPEFLTIKTPDGVELNAWIIKPKGFDPSHRYPLLMTVYGGPGSQTVTDVWGGGSCLGNEMRVRGGYRVASVDHRG